MSDEIKEPTLKLCWNEHAVRRAAEVLRAAGLQLMAEDVEAQFPKPSIEEPTGDCVVFFSMRHPRQGVGWAADDGKWEDGTGSSLPWVELVGDAKPEDVLLYRRAKYPERPDVAPEETNDYKLGVSDTTFNILTKLRVLRSEAITSERKNAYDVAIKTVKAMQP